MYTANLMKQQFTLQVSLCFSPELDLLLNKSTRFSVNGSEYKKKKRENKTKLPSHYLGINNGEVLIIYRKLDIL